MTLPGDDIAKAGAALAHAKRIVVFTGAGVSAESGIDTFRDDAGGLWKRYPPEQFATPAGLVTLLVVDPARVAAFIHDLLSPVASARPNAGHRALAALEAGAAELTVVTQNVDRLHQDAGSRRVLEVHGSLFDIVDADGGAVRTLSRADMERIVASLARARRGLLKRARLARALAPLLGIPRPRVGAGGVGVALSHRPNVVLFGEALPEPAWSDAQRAAAHCDVMLVVGTSGAVYPAAGLPEQAAAKGARIIGVGPERGELQSAQDVWLHGKAGEVLPVLIESWRRARSG